MNHLFELHKRGILKIPQQVIKILEKYKQLLSNDDEACGILMGRYIIDSDDIVIDFISVPTKTDIRSRFRFFRSKKSHQDFHDRIWHSSSGRYNYLGEWHTHPEPNPRPSKYDIKNWKKVLKKSTFGSDFLLFIILGTEEVSIWQGFKKDLSFVQLSIMEESYEN